MRTELIMCDHCKKDLVGIPASVHLTSSEAFPGDRPKAWYEVKISLDSQICTAFEMPGPKKITGQYQFCSRECIFNYLEARK